MSAALAVVTPETEGVPLDPEWPFGKLFAPKSESNGDAVFAPVIPNAYMSHVALLQVEDRVADIVKEPVAALVIA